jgi:uncharacterized protein YndB with AHSA1/START domain
MRRDETPQRLVIAEPLATRPEPTTLRLERLLPAPVDLVWTYLADSDKRALWLGSGQLGQGAGTPLVLEFRASDLSGGLTRDGAPAAPGEVNHTLHALVTRCEPPHLLAFNWSPDGTGSESTIELRPEGNQTRLILTHIRLSDVARRTNTAAGWHAHIGILCDLLAEITPPRRFWPSHAAAMASYSAPMAD